MHYMTPQQYAVAVIRYYNKLLYKGYSLQLSPIEQASYYMQDAVCRCVERGTDNADYCYKQVCSTVAEFSDLPVPRSMFEEMLYYYRVHDLAIYLNAKLEQNMCEQAVTERCY